MNTAASIVDHASGAFCRDNHVAVKGAATGSLSGLTFATKDVFDVAGTVTGFGNPDWLRTHAPASETARAVKAVLNAGADMVGRTHTDELAYSLSGENVHYGTPLNPRAPPRVPGGSSCGSVSAVACGVVDFALGSDCGGSIRLPASYCGVLGMRPSHGRVSLEGVIPFASSFDVAGWFAADAEVFERVGAVLLGDDAEPAALRRLLVADDAFALVDPAISAASKRPLEIVSGHLRQRTHVTVSSDGLESWMDVFRIIQGAEIWANHGAWITNYAPVIGPATADRLKIASRLGPDDVLRARAKHREVISQLESLIDEGDVLVLPTSPRIAPLKATGQDTLEVTYRFQAMSLLCIAGLGGLPQISLPLAESEGCPLGISIIGRKGSDRALLSLAHRIMEGVRK